jgi:hypothetical protein
VTVAALTPNKLNDVSDSAHLLKHIIPVLSLAGFVKATIPAAISFVRWLLKFDLIYLMFPNIKYHTHSVMFSCNYHALLVGGN